MKLLHGCLLIAALLLQASGPAGAAETAVPGNEPARPLTERGLDNLVAFSRLLGILRYFHPSDQAVAADWDSLAIAGAQRAEKAADAAELSRILEETFRPVAPTLRVFPDGHPPAVDGALAPRPGGAVRKVAWRHFGFAVPEPDPLFRSFRLDDKTLAPGEPHAGRRLGLDRRPSGRHLV